MVGRNHCHKETRVAFLKAHECRRANADWRRPVALAIGNCRRNWKFPCLADFRASMVLAGLLDHCRIDHRVHSLRLASVPHVADEGCNLCLCESSSGRHSTCSAWWRDSWLSNNFRCVADSCQRVCNYNGKGQATCARREKKCATAGWSEHRLMDPGTLLTSVRPH